MTEWRRGEIWWGEAPDEKGRPYLVLTRDEAIPVLRTVLAAPVTRTVRGIATEVLLGPAEGLPAECAATIDNTLAVPKAMLVRRMGALGPPRPTQLCGAWRAAVGC
ncbi:MAG: type II toxin-antitoxin system PemK/MazF family toxin [Egibacteraceae bacterium]